MKIKDIRASIHRVPTPMPLFKTSDETSTRVFCEVETDDGQVGFGMTGRFVPQAVLAVLKHDILPATRDMDPRDLEAIHDRLSEVLAWRGVQTGANMSALSCFDLALWDLIGKASGRTVAQLLGGHSDRADVYVTYGFGKYDKDQLVQVGRDLMGAGHTRLKMLVDGQKRGWRVDAERVRHVRDGLGYDVDLALDANETYDLDQMMALARNIQDCNIAWIEDPIIRNEARHLRHLRTQFSIPIAAGQMDGHIARFRELLEHDAIDIPMPNPLFNGGMTETRRVAHLAQAYNRPVSDAGGGTAYSLHHVAGLRNGTCVEVHMTSDIAYRRLFLDASEPEGDTMRVPDRPGFGLTPNRDALKDTLLPPA